MNSNQNIKNEENKQVSSVNFISNLKTKKDIEPFTFSNKIANRKELETILSWTFRNYGVEKACILADILKEIGFKYATKGGISISIEDLKVPRVKNQILVDTKKHLDKIETKYKQGQITETEWFQKRIAAWGLTSEVIKTEIINYFENTDPLNPVYMMAFSGARGNISQVRQLIGMRGLMSDQKGEIIGLPIQKNFREGLRITDFIISSYGARKGLVDTAIRTADSGYLTRRLIDIAQDVIIRQFDCRSNSGIVIYRSHKNPKFKIGFGERIIGRILSKAIHDPMTKDVLWERDQEINYSISKTIDDSSIQKIHVRSPLTCQSSRSICQKCYGWDLAQAKLIKIGEAVGIIGAQSIGEPGTQLTMRTFHTGGIFTAEAGEEIKVSFSGQIKFSPLLSSYFIRNMYGEYAEVLEKASYIEIINYKNEKTKIWLEKDTIILVRNNEFVKKDQVIAQIQSQQKAQSEQEIQKEVYSQYSGEIYFQVKEKYNFFEYNTLVWILSGKIYKVPSEAKQNLKVFSNQKNFQSIGKAKLTSQTREIMQSIKSLENNKIDMLQGFTFFEESQLFKNINPISENLDNIRYILIDKWKNFISLSSTLNANLNIKNGVVFGQILKPQYLTKTGGILFNLNIKILPTKLNSYSEITCGGTLLWIEEESYPLNRDSAILLVENSSIVSSGLEIAKNIFCKNNGIISVREKTKIIQDISIKIGSIYSFPKKRLDLKTFVAKFDNRFFFPGEILFGRIHIKQMVLSEVLILGENVDLILRPVFQYQVTKPKTIKSKLANTKKSIKSIAKYKKYILVKDTDRISSNIGLNLVKSQAVLIIEDKKTFNDKQIFLKFNYFLQSKKLENLSLNRIEELSVFDHLPNKIKKQRFSTLFKVKKLQIIEPYTTVGSFHIYNEKFSKVYEIRSKFSKYQEIMIISESDTQSFYFDEINIPIIKSQFLLENELISEGVRITNSGKILNKKGTNLQIRLAKPYLFSEGAIIQRNHGDFILKDESLGLLIFKILKTEDIVQGLPKIEEILEARIPKACSALIENPGLITNIDFQPKLKALKINLLTLSDSLKAKSIVEIPYLFRNVSTSNLKNFYQVNLTQSINDGLINSHEVLNIYFNYYQKRNSLYKSTLRSLKKVASILIESIQSIYYAQGIRISDKHIEVILRQMMSRVEIEDPGDTPFLPGELINIKQIKIINEMLNERNKKLVYYKPTLLGLTKSSLTTESFISAASFQETTRILTQAAIEGKIDWLRGLKENVIIGRLIPAGSGFISTTDLSKRLLSSRIKKYD